MLLAVESGSASISDEYGQTMGSALSPDQFSKMNHISVLFDESQHL